MQPQLHPTERHELFRKYARDALGAIDVGHSDAPETGRAGGRWKALDAHLAKVFPHPFDALNQHRETVPSDLRALGARELFAPLGGFDGITGEHVAIWPETSTFLVKSAVRAAAHAARRGSKMPVVLIPEGNFRYNFFLEPAADIKLVCVPVDKTKKKLAPQALRRAIAAYRDRPIAAFILENPNNPWMQPYESGELFALMRIAREAGILFIEDLYLAGTEDPMIEPIYAASAIGRAAQAEREALRQNLLTVRGMRRVFGADKRAKAGFAASHNPAIIAGILTYVRATHMRWLAGRHAEVKWALERRTRIASSVRAQLAAKRALAESIFADADVRVIGPAKAGPFITIGFSKDIEKRLARAGFSDGYALGEYVALIGGALLMPLCSMHTSEIGFRVNATAPLRDLRAAASGLQRALARVSAGEGYESVRAQAEEIRRACDEARTKALR